jgi:hypothetical protein
MRTMLDDCTRRFVEKLIKPFEKLHWFMFDRSITRFSFSMKVFPSQSVCRYTSQSQTFRHSFPFPTGNDHIIASLWFLVIFRQVSSDDSKRNKPIISRYYIRLHLRKSETTNNEKAKTNSNNQQTQQTPCPANSSGVKRDWREIRNDGEWNTQRLPSSVGDDWRALVSASSSSSEHSLW